MHRRFVLALLAAAGVQGQEKKTMKKVSGSFDVKVAPQPGAPAGLSRLSIDKHFHGPLEAASIGEMLATGGDDGSGGYVAMERVTGTLDGRSGSFVLQHSGVMAPGMMKIDVVVSPGSGTGELKGLTGTLTIRIEGKAHFYDFEFSLPH